MILRMLGVAAMIATLTPAVAAAEAVDPGTADKILAVLKGMNCEVDPADIEAEADGFELDDVFCIDGQYDMEMNANLEVVTRRKE